MRTSAIFYTVCPNILHGGSASTAGYAGETFDAAHTLIDREGNNRVPHGTGVGLKFTSFFVQVDLVTGNNDRDRGISPSAMTRLEPPPTTRSGMLCLSRSCTISTTASRVVQRSVVGGSSPKVEGGELGEKWYRRSCTSSCFSTTPRTWASKSCE